MHLLEIIGLVALIVGIIAARKRVWQTTLRHVWLWGLFAAVALFGVNLLPPDDNPLSNLPALRFAAWSLTFTPAIMLLGIKKPQHIGWHGVTVALWGILVLPAVEGAILRPGAPIELGGLRPWFLLALTMLSPVTFFAGRYRWPAVLLGIAQGLFFARYLPWGEWLEGWGSRGGSPLGWLLAAAVLAEWQFHREYRTDNPLDRIWLDFRDSFGLFWGLRVAERINATAVLIAWPFRLEWWGVMPTEVNSDQPPPMTMPRELRISVRGLLRRFVDQNWLTTRWPTADETNDSSVG